MNYVLGTTSITSAVAANDVVGNRLTRQHSSIPGKDHFRPVTFFDRSFGAQKRERGACRVLRTVSPD